MGEHVCTVPACDSAQEQGHQWDSELGHQWDSELYSSIHFSKKTNEHSYVEPSTGGDFQPTGRLMGEETGRYQAPGIHISLTE